MRMVEIALPIGNYLNIPLYRTVPKCHYTLHVCDSEVNRVCIIEPGPVFSGCVRICCALDLWVCLCCAEIVGVILLDGAYYIGWWRVHMGHKWHRVRMEVEI